MGSRLDVGTIVRVVRDILEFVSSMVRPRAQLVAENLFLRKQLALYLERRIKPRRVGEATRLMLVALSRLIDWRPLLTVVKPDTLISMASKGIPPVLAMEIETTWLTATAGRPTAVDRGDGRRGSHSGVRSELRRNCS